MSGEGEMKWTLGIIVSRDCNASIVSSSQEVYINNLIERFKLQNAAIVTTPLALGVILSKERCPTTPRELQKMTSNIHRELIGSLQYGTLAAHPDISYAVNKLAQFLNHPGLAHLEAIV